MHNKTRKYLSILASLVCVTPLISSATSVSNESELNVQQQVDQIAVEISEHHSIDVLSSPEEENLELFSDAFADFFTQSAPTSYANQSLKDYAKQCDKEIGTTVPDFDCLSGTKIPVTNKNGRNCDRPSRLNRDCLEGSRFLKLKENNDHFVVGLCRKTGSSPQGHNVFGDIAVIQHNKKNGATCFYQALASDLSGNVKAPSKGTSSEGGFRWYTPKQTANTDCAGCHDNGPLIRSPYLTQITGSNSLPGKGDPFFNRDQPYYFVGEDFEDWHVYSVEVEGNSCIDCHRLGVNNIRSGGTARDFGIRATSESESRKNPHSNSSPIWMPPGKTTFSRTQYNNADEIHDCGDEYSESSSLPNDNSCRIREIPRTVAKGEWTNSGGGNHNAIGNIAYELQDFGSGKVDINLLSDVDTYLTVIDTDSNVIFTNDDIDYPNLNSRIHKTISSSDTPITIIAGTFSSGKRGNFTLQATRGKLKKRFYKSPIMHLYAPFEFTSKRYPKYCMRASGTDDVGPGRELYQIKECSNNQKHHFYLAKSRKRGYVKIKNMKYATCVYASNSLLTEDGHKNVYHRSCDDRNGELWKVTESEDGYYQFKSYRTGKCLHWGNDRTDHNDRQVRQSTCDGSSREDIKMVYAP